AGYAPYENVGEQDHPPILATTSVNDTRVLYVEPAKWVARMRATAPDGRGRPDVLLKTEMSAGHGGVSGRYRAWRDRAFTQAWMLDRMGLAEAAPVVATLASRPARCGARCGGFARTSIAPVLVAWRASSPRRPLRWVRPDFDRTRPRRMASKLAAAPAAVACARR